MTRILPIQGGKTAPPAYLVLQRSDGDWSPATKIIGVYPSEVLAEDRAAKEKLEHPHQHFGVAALCCEARIVPNPVEIIRVREAS